MEDKEIARDAIGSAKRWLKSGKFNADAGSYDSALYSLEMSAEIALKAVLFALRVDVPKTHMIGDILAVATKESKKIPDEFRRKLDDTVETFNTLLELRAASGYMFETKVTLNDLKKKYDEYIVKAADIVELCGKAVDAVSKT